MVVLCHFLPLTAVKLLLFDFSNALTKPIPGLCCSGVLPREPMPSSTIRLPSSEELEGYAVEQWEV